MIRSSLALAEGVKMPFEWITLVIMGGQLVLAPGIDYVARRVRNRRQRARQDRECLRRLETLKQQLLSSKPTLSRQIREPGLVQLEGKVVGQSLIQAPLSGKAVAGYRLKIEQVGFEHLVQVDLACMTGFGLDDGGPSPVEVCPDRCLPLLTAEEPQEVSFEQLTGRALKELVDRHPRLFFGLVSSRRFRLTEYLLEVGETVFVQGLASRGERNADAEAGYRSVEWKVRVQAPKLDGILAVSDRDRATFLSLGIEALVRMMPAGEVVTPAG